MSMKRAALLVFVSFTLVTAWGAWPRAAGLAAALPSDVRHYLADVARFAPDRMAALEAGDVIAKVVQGDGGEIAAVGAVRIRTTRPHVEAYFKQLASWEDGVVLLQVGSFSRPPAAADVAKLKLDPEDVEILKNCRTGDCELQVAGAFDALHGAINWKAPDYAAQLEARLKQRMVSYVAEYQAKGDAALIIYNNESKPISLRDQWRKILANSPFLFDYAPALRQYLEGYPAAKLPGSSDHFYWSKENQGLKPIIGVTHGIVYRDPAKTDRTTVAQKQIYASRYYEGSLTVTTIIDGGEQNGRPVVYVLFFNRSQSDLLRGFGGGVKRKIAQSEVVKGTEYTLGGMRDALEKAAGVR
jgi:hypothetical protein